MSTDKKPTEYLLNYVEIVPGILEAVYDVVTLQHPVNLDQMRDLMWFHSAGDSTEDHVLNALNFLHANDVIVREDGLYRAPFGPQPSYGFRALLLKGLRAQTDKQRHFMHILELLIRDGRMGIEVNPLLGFLNEQKLVTANDKSPVNDLKLGFWMRLLDFLGVMHQVAHAKSVSLTPDGRLMHHLLTQSADTAGEVSLQRFLETVEKQYFPVTTRDGVLHPGVGTALLRMRERALIDVTVKSDAMAFPLSPTVTASHITLRGGAVVEL